MAAVIENRLPTPDEYWLLKTGIGEDHYLLRESVPTALHHSLFGVIATVEGEIVGCGRLVGDGAMFCYLQDVMVLPRFHRQGIGTLIVDSLMAWIDSNMPEKIYIGLFTREELHGFYARYSFRGSAEFLYGMCAKKRTGHHSIQRAK